MPLIDPRVEMQTSTLMPRRPKSPRPRPSRRRHRFAGPHASNESGVQKRDVDDHVDAITADVHVDKRAADVAVRIADFGRRKRQVVQRRT